MPRKSDSDHARCRPIVPGRCAFPLLSLLFFLVCGGFLAAHDSVEILPPDPALYPAEVHAELLAIMARTAHEAASLFPQRFSVSLAAEPDLRPDAGPDPSRGPDPEPGPDYRLSVIGRPDGRGSSLVLRLTRTADTASS